MRRKFVPIAIMCGVLSSIVWSARAEERAKPAAATATPATELTVSAQAVEQPLLKYRLLPAEYELRPGNAAPILLRLPWEQTPYFANVVPTFQDYLDRPLNDPKVRGAKDVFAPGFYRALKRAAYRRSAEWGFPIGEEPAMRILLPDVQGSRDIVARGLSVWIRNRISLGQLDEAREGILVGLAVSRHYAQSPFVITQLVCAAIDSILMNRLEELISQPGSPNLYWALTALPRPLVDLRAANELEQRSLQMTVSGLDDLDLVRTNEEWAQRVDGLYALFAEQGSPARSGNFSKSGLVEGLAQHGRAELPAWVSGGADRVAKMSDAEVAVRWFVHVHIEQSQKIAAFSSLEPPAALPRLTKLQQEIAALHAELSVPTLFVMESPANIYAASWGLQRRIDALRVVEAIRGYAAGRGSRLPDRLDQISDTPIPNDPFTGKPFVYAANGKEATLSGKGQMIGGQEVKAINYHIAIRQ